MSTSPRVAILVPRRAGDAHRDEVWQHLAAWWDEHFPAWPVYVGDHDDGPFNRSAAINTAAAAAGAWDVALIIDADVLTEPANIRAAVGAAWHTGSHVVGYHERIHLNAGGSRQIIDGYAGDWRPFTRTLLLDAVSSMTAIRRDLFDKVDGFDPAFVGWGWEDVAFRLATEAAAGGPIVRIAGTLWHLWHPKSPENDHARPTFTANRERCDAYKAARWDWPAIAEIRGLTP